MRSKLSQSNAQTIVRMSYNVLRTRKSDAQILRVVRSQLSARVICDHKTVVERVSRNSTTFYYPCTNHNFFLPCLLLVYIPFKCLFFRLQLTMDVAAHTSSHTTVSAEEHRKRVVDIPFLTRTCIRIIERMNVGRAIAFTHV